MLTKKVKANIIKEARLHEKDTGSANVQVGVLSRRITELADHLKKNPKDFHSRRGLLMLVGKRRRLEGYLRTNDVVKYRALIQKLNIREVKPR